MIFGFNLCAVPLLAVLVTYFGNGLEELSGWKPLEDGKVYCYQHWKRVSVVVDFQDNLYNVNYQIIY